MKIIAKNRSPRVNGGVCLELIKTFGEVTRSNKGRKVKLFLGTVTFRATLLCSYGCGGISPVLGGTCNREHGESMNPRSLPSVDRIDVD